MYNFTMPNKPDPAQIVSWRDTRRRKRRRGLSGLFYRLGTGGLAALAVLLTAGLIAGAFYYATYTAGLPSIAGLPELLGPGGSLRYPTQVFDRSGEQLLYVIENPNTLSAEYIYLENMPQTAVDATLAVRDPGFWEHNGYLINAEKPTIAEQLVRELLLAAEPESLQKTWRTRLLAAQITKEFGRETILEWYLNNASYGQLAFGIDEAAWVYFGKSAQEINLAESALLAAAVDAPALNPIDTPQVAIERQRQVLNTMLATGSITSDQAFSANNDPILVQTSALSNQVLAADFVQAALDSLSETLGEERIQRGGFRIITTLDLELQNQVSCTLGIQLARLSGSLATGTLGGINCTGASLLPTLTADQILNHPDTEGAVVIIDPSTGEVLALAGDGAATRPAGTILTPFIYLTGFTRGLNPASLLWDIPASLPVGLEGYTNLDGQFHGPMRIRTALIHDYHVPALSVLQQIGPTNAWRTVQQSGVYSLEVPTGDTFSPLLDQGAASLIEVTHAYSMFANQGTLAGHTANGDDDALPPTMVLTVSDYTGRFLIDHRTPELRPVTTAQLAYLITDILSDEPARRESLGHPNPLEIGRTNAAKLGQTISGSHAWTVGYTPDRVVGVWLAVPQDDGVDTQLSPLAAAGLWHAVTKTAAQDQPISAFPEPIGIRYLTVCDPSGLLPTEYCPQTVTETFITGSEPVQTDNLYRPFTINSQTGRLATIYTPTEFLQERVFLVVPAEAAEWAEDQGLDIPPTTYDVIFNPGSTSDIAAITTPEIFSYVSGEVQIRGTAAGGSFDYYRVQVGAGLNPRQWLQVGDGQNRPVEDGLLAEWDTSGLDGLYAIQLQVVDENQGVQTAVIQVTIDNQPPAVQVLHPIEGQAFEFPEQRMVTFQAQVTDNLAIEKVEFLVDGELISSFSDPPYAAPWNGSLGEHEFTIRATDEAGNETEETITFSLER